MSRLRRWHGQRSVKKALRRKAFSLAPHRSLLAIESQGAAALDNPNETFSTSWGYLI